MRDRRISALSVALAIGLTLMPQLTYAYPGPVFQGAAPPAAPSFDGRGTSASRSAIRSAPTGLPPRPFD